jgi:cystathionine beta-synthase
MERHRRPYANVLELIGWTPLVRLNAVTDGTRTPVYAKCEFMGPGGSVKDRIGVAMIEAAERAGTLRAGGTIVEATSGNTGIALAMAASLKGYRCIFTMPDKMSAEKVKLLRAFGAEVVITPTAVPPDHPDHYLQRARKIAAETPGAVMADQFYNPANPEAHYRTTGPEIWEQSIGVRVSATKPDRSTATDTVIPNSLKSRPTVPVRKATGTKTATSEIVVARTAKPISFEPSKAARRRSFPISMWR